MTFLVVSKSIITSLSTRAVIGHLSGTYSVVRSAKLQAVFAAKRFRDLSPSVVNVYRK